MALIAVLSTITIIAIFTIIFLENDNPPKTLAWLLISIFLPGLGFLLYLIMGRQFAKTHKYRRKEALGFEQLEKFMAYNRDAILKDKSFIEELGDNEKLVKLISKAAYAPLTINNNTTVFEHGEDLFTDIITSLKEAKDHIHLEFYIIRSDQIGTIIKNILLEKAQQGVEIRVIYDGLGSRTLKKSFIQEMKDNGIHVACYAPFNFPWITNSLNYRNHRKIIVVDGQIGYVGGMNIGDEYRRHSDNFTHWRDSHLRIDGEAVHFLQHIFLKDWNFITEQNISDAKYYPPIKEFEHKELIQIAASGPDTLWEPIMQMYFSMIATANKSIYLTTPYFIPNEGILIALKNAALSGLDVRLLIPGPSDKPFVLKASMTYLGELLEAGVKIYQYKKGFIHSKILIVDGIISSSGTANMDIRSFNLNFEINALIFNQKIAKKLENIFMDDLKNSKEIDYDTYRKRPLSTKLIEAQARLFAPLL